MGEIYKNTSECIIWLGEVEEQPIAPIAERKEMWSEVERDELEKRIMEYKLDTLAWKGLQEAGKEIIPTPNGNLDVRGALEILDMVCEGKHYHEMPFFTIPQSGVPPFELNEQWAQSLYSLENILNRSWWTRIWTVQEAFLPEKASICIGPYSRPFKTFLKGAEANDKHFQDFCCTAIKGIWTGYKPSSLHSGFDRLLDLNYLYKARERAASGNESVAHHLFMLSVSRFATVSHDHVYGLFGLISEFFHLDAKPDYTMSRANLYAATTIKFMENAKHLCLVPYGRPQFRAQTKPQTSDTHHQFLRDLPSWTPDWSTFAWYDYFDIYNWGGFTADKMLTYDEPPFSDTILTLQAIHVDTVQEVGPLIQSMDVGPGEFVPMIKKWLDLTHERDLPDRALWNTAHVADHKDVGHEKEDLQSQWWEILKRLADKGASYQDMVDESVREKQEFCHDSMTYFSKRGFYFTTPGDQFDIGGESEFRIKHPKGTCGIALPNVENNDRIFIVKGGRTPLVMRPLLKAGADAREKALAQGMKEEDLENCYTFVGVTYLFGMMQGQAIPENPKWNKVYLL
jgi:hypothetical protein